MKREKAQESKAPETPRNHFDEFCQFVRGQAWMSKDFGTELIVMLMAAQRDAYERGEQHAKETIKASIK